MSVTNGAPQRATSKRFDIKYSMQYEDLVIAGKGLARELSSNKEATQKLKIKRGDRIEKAGHALLKIIRELAPAIDSKSDDSDGDSDDFQRKRPRNGS
jgi:hypothetical protein